MKHEEQRLYSNKQKLFINDNKYDTLLDSDNNKNNDDYCICIYNTNNKRKEKHSRNGYQQKKLQDNLYL